jgi:phosphoribosyl 1,2-cyclic phosphodiesterase
MRIQILSAGPTPGHPLTGFLIDGVLAIDAGPLGHTLTVDEQAAVTDVLLTHSHIDHVAGLPVFLDTVYRTRPDCPVVHALPHTLSTLRADLFNGRLMPDFIDMSRVLPPFLKVREVVSDRPFTLGRYTVTPMPLTHSVPTVGYVVDDGEIAVAVLTDTAPAPQVFARVAETPRLLAVFLECSFPRRMADLAKVTTHLTTEQFLDAAGRFPEHVRKYAVHIKPRFWDEVTAELESSPVPNVRIGTPGMNVQYGLVSEEDSIR